MKSLHFWFKAILHRASDSTFELLNRASYLSVSRTHPAEIMRERLVVARMLAHRATKTSGRINENERKTLENRFFISSRLATTMAERRALVNPQKRFQGSHYWIAGILDLISYTSKLAVNAVVGRMTKVNDIDKADVLVIGYNDAMEKVLTPYLPDIVERGNSTWVILANYYYASQKRLIERLKTKGRRTLLVGPGFRWCDFRSSLSTTVRGTIRSVKVGRLNALNIYCSLIHSFVRLEIAAESKRTSLLVASGCKLVFTLDDSDYMAFFRNGLFRKSGAEVIGVAHGIGFYGPHQSYTSYCVWGSYMRDRYVEEFRFPPSMMVVTGNPAQTMEDGQLPEPVREISSNVTFLLQPLTVGNRWSDVREMFEGYAGWSDRQVVPPLLIVKFHPMQSKSSKSRVHRLIRDLGLMCEFKEGFGLDHTWLRESQLCVTNFSTAGLDAIAAGVPTLFFSKGTNARVPISQYVPESQVRTLDEYGSALFRFLDHSDDRQALLLRQKGALRHFFDPEGRKLLEGFHLSVAERFGTISKRIDRCNYRPDIRVTHLDIDSRDEAS